MTSPDIDTSPATATWQLWLLHQALLAQAWLISRILPWLGVYLCLDWELRLLTGHDARPSQLLGGILLLADSVALRSFLRWRRTALRTSPSWRQALASSWASYALDWAGLLTVALHLGSDQPDHGQARTVIAAGVVAWALVSIARRRPRTREGQWLALAAGCQDSAAALLLAGLWEPDLARHVGLFEFTGLLWLAFLAGVLPLGSLIRREFGLSRGVSGAAEDATGTARQRPEPADAQEQS